MFFLPRLLTPQRLQQGLWDTSLSGSSAEAELPLGPIQDPVARFWPSPRLSYPANQTAVVKATAWRQGTELTSTESVLGAPKQGLEKGDGMWV